MARLHELCSPDRRSPTLTRWVPSVFLFRSRNFTTTVTSRADALLKFFTVPFRVSSHRSWSMTTKSRLFAASVGTAASARSSRQATTNPHKTNNRRKAITSPMFSCQLSFCNFQSRPDSEPRPLIVPGGGLLVGVGHPEDHRLVKGFSDDLQADGQ